MGWGIFSSARDENQIELETIRDIHSLDSDEFGPRTRDTDDGETPWRVLVFLLVMGGAVFCMHLLEGAVMHPSPAPKTVDKTMFSEERAKNVLNELVGIGIRNYCQWNNETGKYTNEESQALLQQQLETIDKNAKDSNRVFVRKVDQNLPECKNLRPGCDCTSRSVTGTLQGIQGSTSSIALTAHHDSRKGPGATDDAIGVAVMMEVLRVLEASAPLPFNVHVFFVDHEESGTYSCYGAWAVMQGIDQFGDVSVIMNVEGAGNAVREAYGRGNSAKSAELYTSGSKHPIGFSLVEYLFGLLQVGYTDASVYSEKGAHVLDMLYLHNRLGYHTTIDDVKHIQDGALQHLGENVLGMIEYLRKNGLPKQDAKRIEHATKSENPHRKCSSSTGVSSDSFVFTSYFGIALYFPETLTASLVFSGVSVFCALLMLVLYRTYTETKQGDPVQVRLVFQIMGYYFVSFPISLGVTCGCAFILSSKDIRTWYGEQNLVRVVMAVFVPVFVGSAVQWIVVKRNPEVRSSLIQGHCYLAAFLTYVRLRTRT